MSDVSKFCADSLRDVCSSHISTKLKSSHAHELVAAFFGYKSHAALLHEKNYPLSAIEEAAILAPDLSLMEARRSQLKNLPDNLPVTDELARVIVKFLEEEKYFGGSVWLPLVSYITDKLLIDIDYEIMDGLSGAMAETNAEFSDFPTYEEPEIVDEGDELIVTVKGIYGGINHDEKPFSGDTIDFQAELRLPRIAGKRAFGHYELDVGGGVRDDWRDPDTYYEIPNIRPKDQFLQMTGGFRFGETNEQFENRQLEIHTLRNRITKGNATVKDINRLSTLLGNDDEF